MRRRTFLQTSVTAGIVVGLGGCASDTDNETPAAAPTTQTPETTTEDEAGTTDEEATTENEEPDIDRPDNFRWDMVPGRNEQLRDNLGQYVEDSVGGLVEEHPAFEYSTESKRDDIAIDFNALKLYRDSNFDIMAQNTAFEEVGPGLSAEEYVEAFVNEDMHRVAKTEVFRSHDSDAPESYTSEAWLNAETVEESLDLGHSFIGSAVPQQRIGPAEQGVILREAYKRHHDFDVLAWETNMGFETGYDDRITGLMYSPDDDKLRAHDVSPPTQVGQQGEDTDFTRKWHSEIQEWNIFDESGELFHPLLFHTDEWNRQNPGFRRAKGEAYNAIAGIANGTSIFNLSEAIEGEGSERQGSLAPTTGLTKQLTRTMLEYNENNADFQDMWDYANISELLLKKDGNYIIDTASEDESYERVFDGNLAVYEVEDESVVDEVWEDQAGEYDNFGQVYDGLEEVA